MKEHISEKLRDDKWSPEIISALGKRSGECPISHEWIYQLIWTSKHGNKRKNKQYKRLYEHLRHSKRRRKRSNRKDNRGSIKNRISIEDRPKVVEKRKRLGDIEVDLMLGKNHKSPLLVMTDRSTRKTWLKKLKTKRSEEVKKAILSKLKNANQPLRTLTFDNDLAFSQHEAIAEKLNVKAYFTRPYSSQEKGTVENRIGVIRRFLPKKTDLRLIDRHEIKKIENKLNNRPLRKFNYLTANQVLEKKIALIT
jgi:IS30 family transposase